MQRSEDIAILLRPPTREIVDPETADISLLLNPVAPPLPIPEPNGSGESEAQAA